MIYATRQRICRAGKESGLGMLVRTGQPSWHTMMRLLAWLPLLISLLSASSTFAAEKVSEMSVTATEDQFVIRTSALEAAVRKRGYVTGVFSGSFLDRKTG